MALVVLRSVEPGACEVVVHRLCCHECEVCTRCVNAVRSAFRMGRVYVHTEFYIAKMSSTASIA